MPVHQSSTVTISTVLRKGVVIRVENAAISINRTAASKFAQACQVGGEGAGGNVDEGSAGGCRYIQGSSVPSAAEQAMFSARHQTHTYTLVCVMTRLAQSVSTYEREARAICYIIGRMQHSLDMLCTLFIEVCKLH